MTSPTLAQMFEQALQYQQTGQLAPAWYLYRQILELAPDNADALHMLGVLSLQSGHTDSAEDLIRRAVAIHPEWAEAHINLGAVFQAQRRLDDAVASYRRALEIKPGQVVALNNMGNVLTDQGKLDEAVVAYRAAIAGKPDYFEAHNNLGVANRLLGLVDDAIACFQQCLTYQPNYLEARNNLANAFKDQGRLDEAIATYRDALALNPTASALHSNLLYTLQYHPGYDAPALLREHREWNRVHAEPLAASQYRHENDRDPERRLRIGYVSPDFRQHCQAFFTLPLLSSHDHRQFEIYCYADVSHPDGITERLQAHADVWRNTARFSDEQIATHVHRDQIDILVDLTMHMAKGRPLVFARRPAPVQVAWLAYPGTTGLNAIDYRLTDPYLDPPGQHDAYYSETSIRLPRTFWCYDPLANQPDINPLPAQTLGGAGHITFGCLNNFCKVNPAVLQLWARVMRAVPDSRLMLLTSLGSHQQHTLDFLQREGIHPHRIQMETMKARTDYLRLYHYIDIGLDSFPYNGHTTSLDSFWMGVPVVTLIGQTVVGRAGLSQLTNLGLPELIARTPDEYVRIACDLAQDLPRLAALRSGLRQRTQASPLMDAPAFARAMEEAYRAMWRRWCAKPPPLQ